MASLSKTRLMHRGGISLWPVLCNTTPDYFVGEKNHNTYFLLRFLDLMLKLLEAKSAIALTYATVFIEKL